MKQILRSFTAIFFFIVGSPTLAQNAEDRSCSDNAEELAREYQGQLESGLNKPLHSVKIGPDTIELPTRIYTKTHSDSEKIKLPLLPCNSGLSWVFTALIETREGKFQFSLVKQMEDKTAPEDRDYFSQMRAKRMLSLRSPSSFQSDYLGAGYPTGIKVINLNEGRDQWEYMPIRMERSISIPAEEVADPGKFSCAGNMDRIANYIARNYPPSLVPQLSFICKNAGKEKYHPGYEVDFQIHRFGDRALLPVGYNKLDGKIDCDQIPHELIAQMFQKFSGGALLSQGAELSCLKTEFNEKDNISWVELTLQRK